MSAVPTPTPTTPPTRLLRFRHAVRARDLAVLARNALARYDVGVDRLTLLGRHQNTMFRLVAADGRRFVVRVNMPGMRSELDIASEMAWLDALRRETDLVVPRPLATRSGEFMTVAAAPGVPEPRAVSVFDWIDGRTVGDALGAPVVRQMGVALGRLQDHADCFVPPASFTDSRLDSAWGFGVPPLELEGSGADGVWTDRRTLDLLIAGRQVDLLAFVIDRHLISAEELPIYMARVEKRLAALEALVARG